VQPDGTVKEEIRPQKYMCLATALSEAQGIWFDCPKCTVTNGGPIGTHKVRCFFPDRGVPENIGLNKEGKPVRWAVSGRDFTDLTLRPSIFLQGGRCGWHGFITDGEVTSV